MENRVIRLLPMNNNSLSVRSSIRSSLKRSLLFKGTLFALMGALSLIAAAILLPAEKLSHYGFFIFAFAMALITYGLLPYRRLCRLENNPDELRLDSDHILYYLKKGNAVLAISKNDIQSFSYFDLTQKYGIKCLLKNGTEVSFFYFTKRAYDLLFSDS